jgi:hypothetical protein
MRSLLVRRAVAIPAVWAVIGGAVGYNQAQAAARPHRVQAFACLVSPSIATAAPTCVTNGAALLRPVLPQNYGLVPPIACVKHGTAITCGVPRHVLGR